MLYYSTNRKAPAASLRDAVTKGLAPDRGLYMPETINRLGDSFFAGIDRMTFQDMALEVAKAFFADDVEADALRRIVSDTLAFPCPVVPVADKIFSLELFHGPTLAFKDVGARFMARLLQYFIQKDIAEGKAPERTVNVLVATSGDTGSAVANGFLGVEGIHVWVLYPKGKVSQIQECQFTTLGQNITAVEVDGVFDDCQRLVKTAFMDADLCSRRTLTSANSINVARFLPQSFYYFNAYAQLKAMGRAGNVVFCVPSGNFGNITAGLIAVRMGLPAKRFIAANNANDVFYQYLQTGLYTPKPSVQTVANAMDVGDPSNFARILELYPTVESLRNFVSGRTYTDEEIKATVRSCHKTHGYDLDPHGACAYRALLDTLREDECGVFLETAHPAKFKQVVDPLRGTPLPMPPRLQAFMKGEKQSVGIEADYGQLKELLLQSRVKS